jgi:hypothetical protein
MNNKNNQKELYLLAILKRLNVEGLLYLFIKAKTSSQHNIDKPPGEYLQNLEELGGMVDNLLEKQKNVLHFNQ